MFRLTHQQQHQPSGGGKKPGVVGWSHVVCFAVMTVRPCGGSSTKCWPSALVKSHQSYYPVWRTTKDAAWWPCLFSLDNATLLDRPLLPSLPWRGLSTLGVLFLSMLVALDFPERKKDETLLKQLVLFNNVFLFIFFFKSLFLKSKSDLWVWVFISETTELFTPVFLLWWIPLSS